MATSIKRDHKSEDGKSKTGAKKPLLDVDSQLYKSFSSYRCELDTRNDKYERLVKVSRDITIQSKRLIFGLLRKDNDLLNLVSEAEEKVEHLKQECISKVSTELVDEDPYKFTRAFSPGFQEFIEAVTLLHYMKDKTLVEYEDICKLYFDYPPNVLLTHFDYMLGVADLTGELMRMAINSIGQGVLDRVDDICGMLRAIYNRFSVFAGTHREMNRKISVMRNSLHKVENACYTLKVRGSEVPSHMIQDLISLSEDTVE